MPRNFDADLTHAELAERLGVSRSRINQIERSALRKLRRAIEAEAELVGLTPREWLAG